MKSIMSKAAITAIVLVLGGVTSQAATYSDASGDTRWGNALMDIIQVEVTHDVANINFDLTLGDAGSFWANEFAGFSLGIDSVAGGDTANNAWGSTYYMSSGMDFFSGGGGGAGAPYLNTYSAALGGWPEWVSGDNTWVEWTEPGISGNVISFSISRAALGLTSPTASFDFDVYTQWSSGDIEDALGSSTQITANGYDSGANINTYVIPEPASVVMTLVGAGALFASRRFKV